MKRLTSDTPNGNFETALNFVYGKGGWAHIRHDGEHEDVKLTEWAKRQCKLRGCGEVLTLTQEEIDWQLCDCMMDAPICPISLAYCFASQAVHLRSRLKMYEDTGLEPEEITTADYGCVFYCNRKCNLDGDFCIEGPGCPRETDAETAKHLLELAQAEKDGRLVVLPCKVGDTVYEVNKRDFVSTYEVISIHVSSCSILVGWNLVDGIYSNLNGFEVSALGKNIFLTREEAEAAMKKREEANESD